MSNRTAIVSTFVLGWDAYKWLASGAKIKLSVSTNMQIGGGGIGDPKTHIAIAAYNVGDQATTIINLGGQHHESWWQAYIRRRKPKSVLVVDEPSQAQRIPYRFEVGAQWMGFVIQSDAVLKQAENGYLFITVYAARSGREHRVRVEVRKKTPVEAVPTV